MIAWCDRRWDRTIGVMLLVCLFSLTSFVGCALFTKKGANSALDAIQLACIFDSSLDDESALADVCGVTKELLPVIRQLIGQRNAARKAGVPYRGLDAGAFDAAKE